MKKIIMMLSFLFFHPTATADDYKSAQRFTEGDVVSAEVLNDILDRIELSTKTITEPELVGNWQATWKTCINGGPGNCSGLNAGEGWTDAIDSLYRTRTDTWAIRDDGDGTFSIGIEKYCFLGASGGVYYNDPCEMRVAVDASIALFGIITNVNNASEQSGHSTFFQIKRISPTRFFLWKLSSGSNSFVTLQLDRLDTEPPSTADLTAEIGAQSIVLNWTLLDESGITYNIFRKSRGKEESKFAEIAKVTESTYTDSDVSSGNTYLYRVFAKNEFGTGIGSNVVPVRYIKIEAPTGPTKLTAEAIESYVSLDWEAGDDLATGYTIDRKLGSEGRFSTIGTTSTTTAFTDVAVTKGTTYTYVVYASNESGNSLPSAEVTLTFD